MKSWVPPKTQFFRNCFAYAELTGDLQSHFYVKLE